MPNYLVVQKENSVRGGLGIVWGLYINASISISVYINIYVHVYIAISTCIYAYEAVFMHMKAAQVHKLRFVNISTSLNVMFIISS